MAITSPNAKGYSLDKGVIRFKNKLWVAQNSALQTKIITAFHASAIGGHSGVQATYHRINKLFHWKGLKVAVEDFIKQCQICQQAKHLNTSPAGLLQPLPIPEGAWQDLSMDFIEGLPKSEGYSVIMVVVDRLTKYAHFLPLKHPYTAPVVAKLFLDTVVKLHGFPHSIVSDRDKIFLSYFWRELFKLYGVQLAFSTAYHPQTDGQTERINQCLEIYLRCAVHGSPQKWKCWLSLAELWYNSSFHTALGCSPFNALYAYEPNLSLSPLPCQTTSQELQTVIQDRELHLQALKHHLLRAQTKMKIQADKKRSDLQFQPGDQILLKLQPYVQTSIAHRPYPKLAFKYYGPYTVLQRIVAVANKLQLPPDSLIHPVFHIS